MKVLLIGNEWWLAEFTKEELRKLILYIKLISNKEITVILYMLEIAFKISEVDCLPLYTNEAEIIKEFIDLGL